MSGLDEHRGVNNWKGLIPVAKAPRVWDEDFRSFLVKYVYTRLRSHRVFIKPFSTALPLWGQITWGSTDSSVHLDVFRHSEVVKEVSASSICCCQSSFRAHDRSTIKKAPTEHQRLTFWTLTKIFVVNKSCSTESATQSPT